MIRRVIWAMVIVLIAAYFIYNYLENKSKKEREKAETKKIEEVVKASVGKVVKSTNAIDNWEEPLSKGEGFRMAPILTVELEHLWIADRPILFVGAIKDIITEDKENYIIEIERSLFNFKYIFGTELFLELKCPKGKIDSFIKENPDILKNSCFRNGVAVVADIKKIETKTIPDKEDGTREVKIGKGNCIEIVYTGNVLF
jgi:hypothetical protein